MNKCINACHTSGALAPLKFPKCKKIRILNLSASRYVSLKCGVDFRCSRMLKDLLEISKASLYFFISVKMLV